MVTKGAADEHPGRVASSFFDGRKLGCSGAALANGVLANALDYDDGHRLTKGHPGSNVIPAAAAVAESTDAPLDELLAAVAVGYEVAIRAAIALHSRGDAYHASGTVLVSVDRGCLSTAESRDLRALDPASAWRQSIPLTRERTDATSALHARLAR